MITFNKILGNIHSEEWSDKLINYNIKYIELDQWSAQKSRMVVEGEAERYGISLDRHSHLHDGDILSYDKENKNAIVVQIKLSEVMVITLSKVAKLGKDELIRSAIELGHAIGNQHWPAVVKGEKVYVPLTLDKKVMESVMETHKFQNIDYQFQRGEEIIPYLSPYDIRYLFSRSSEHHKHELEH